MEILIDEAGTFAVKGATQNSWCVVAAYVCPETEKRKYQKIIRKLKLREGIKSTEEIKLKHISSEENYLKFLSELNELNGALLCVATDSYLNTEDLVKKHQTNQALSILKNIDDMKYDGGKAAVRHLTSQLEGLSTQLYVQLSCQIHLMHSVVIRGISYFVQRTPHSLKFFRWKIDQKEPTKKIDFEDAFEKFCPALLQSLSLQEPGPLLSWCDYRPMSGYMYKKGELPDYLTNNFSYLKDEGGFDIQKIVRKDMNFIDSKSYEGLQIADLLASGIMRLLRQGFNNNTAIAENLGRLMIQGAKNEPPIHLITFGSAEKADDALAHLVRVLSKFCRPMIKMS